jgi:hypothetical protein
VRKRVFAIVALVLIGGGAAAWRLLHLSDLALIGAGYSAQQMCACLFISHRTKDSCRGDLDPLARKVVSVDVGSDQVTATSFLIARATARYEKPLGCSLKN